LGPRFGTPIWDPDLRPKFGTPILELMPNVISKIKQNSSDMNEIILAPCYVISKIKQNSSDINEIIPAPIGDPDWGPRLGTPIGDPDWGP
jgi:hypothetical protein